MDFSENGKVVQDFLDAVCLQVKAKELHSEIREELGSHVAERIGALTSEGYLEQEAVEEALRQMGSPEEIGCNLNRAHRPLPNWRMVVMLGLFVLVGLFAAAGVESSDSAVIYEGLFFRKTVLTVVGLLVLAGVYFMDYRKLRKYSEGIFIGALGLVSVTLALGSRLNGHILVLPLSGLALPTMELSLLMLLVAAAGSRRPFGAGWIGGIASILYRGVLPLILLGLSGSMLLMLVYLAGYLLLTWHDDRSVKRLLYTGLPAAAAAVYMLARSDSFGFRVQTMLDATGPAQDYYAQTAEAIRSAGWTGYGFASANSNLPFIHSESIFTYLIYCFGWIAAIVIVLLVLLFLAELVRMAFALKDGYGQRITLVIASFFTLMMLWPVLMPFGLAPPGGIELPFVSYGGTGQVFYYAAAGFLLSIYRRKNMLPGMLNT